MVDNCLIYNLNLDVARGKVLSYIGVRTLDMICTLHIHMVNRRLFWEAAHKESFVWKEFGVSFCINGFRRGKINLFSAGVFISRPKGFGPFEHNDGRLMKSIDYRKICSFRNFFSLCLKLALKLASWIPQSSKAANCLVKV